MVLGQKLYVRTSIIMMWILTVLLTGTCTRETEKTSYLASNFEETVGANEISDTLFFLERVPAEQLQDKLVRDSEDLEFYLSFVNQSKIDSFQVFEDGSTRYELKYLGSITDLANNSAYHVIRNFKITGIGEMLSPRGKSELAFIDTLTRDILIYNMGLPEYLPRYIEENSLRFDLDSTTIFIYISGGLSPFICLPVIGCHD